MLIVSRSYQNYQNGAVSNQLTNGRRVGIVLWVSENLLMCNHRDKDIESRRLSENV